MRVLITRKRNLINAVVPNGGRGGGRSGRRDALSRVHPHAIDGLSSNGRISVAKRSCRAVCPASRARRGLKKKKVGERRSTIFRGYSRVLCNRRPMHLAGQSFMAEAHTRKNVCFNFGARLPVTPSPSRRHPFPSRPYSAPGRSLELFGMRENP